MLYTNYILKNDLINRFNSVNLTEVTNSSDAIITQTSDQAVELVASYVRHWYDADTEFRALTLHVAASTYEDTDRVYTLTAGVYVLYLAIQDVPADTLITDTDYWTASDDRNPVLVQVCTDIILYDLLGRNNSGNVPEYRFDRNKDARDTLKMIQSGKIQLDIPLRTFEDDEEEQADLGQEALFGQRNIGNDNDY